MAYFSNLSNDLVFNLSLFASTKGFRVFQVGGGVVFKRWTKQASQPVLHFLHQQYTRWELIN